MRRLVSARARGGARTPRPVSGSTAVVWCVAAAPGLLRCRMSGESVGYVENEARECVEGGGGVWRGWGGVRRQQSAAQEAGLVGSVASVALFAAGAAAACGCAGSAGLGGGDVWGCGGGALLSG